MIIKGQRKDRNKALTSNSMAVHVIILGTFLCRPLPNNNVIRSALSRRKLTAMANFVKFLF